MLDVRIQTPKELTIDEDITGKDGVGALLSSFQQCPRIECIALHLRKAKSDTFDNVFLPQGLKSLETLDIHLAGELYARLQNGCRDLVTLTASIDMCNPLLAVPLIDSHRRTLRNVNLTCGSNMRGKDENQMLGMPASGVLSHLRNVGNLDQGSPGEETGCY
ncbi:MAG: hypothetical protein BYD32DRAFT_463430 [Podila humilis]|nr:MAG: hypothetical protein BYD32DRAFT_463430 [Podila humilis]